MVAPSPPRASRGGQARTSGGGRSDDRGSRRGGGGGERGGGRRPQQSAPQPQAQRDLEITDEKIFQQLQDSGIDLGQEAVLEAFLYFAGESTARRVATQLEEGGYATYVDPSPPGRWLVEAVSRAVPSPEHITAMGSTLRSAARSNNGIYDGWWASEPPEEEDVPLVGESALEDLVPADSVPAEPTANEPGAEEPAASEPVAEDPVAEEPVAEEPESALASEISASSSEP